MRSQDMSDADEAVSRGRTDRIRAVALVFFAAHAALGTWAYVAPHGFYTSFPYPGSDWLTALGSFDGHLVRDLGISWISLAIIGTWAARRGPLAALRVSLAAFAVAGVLHLAFHVTAFPRFSPAVAAAQGLALTALLVVPSVLLARSVNQPRSPR